MKIPLPLYMLCMLCAVQGADLGPTATVTMRIRIKIYDQKFAESAGNFIFKVKDAVDSYELTPHPTNFLRDETRVIDLYSPIAPEAASYVYVQTPGSDGIKVESFEVQMTDGSWWTWKDAVNFPHWIKSTSARTYRSNFTPAPPTDALTVRIKTADEQYASSSSSFNWKFYSNSEVIDGPVFGNLGRNTLTSYSVPCPFPAEDLVRIDLIAPNSAGDGLRVEYVEVLRGGLYWKALPYGVSPYWLKNENDKKLKVLYLEQETNAPSTFPPGLPSTAAPTAAPATLTPVTDLHIRLTVHSGSGSGSTDSFQFQIFASGLSKYTFSGLSSSQVKYFTYSTSFVGDDVTLIKIKALSGSNDGLRIRYLETLSTSQVWRHWYVPDEMPVWVKDEGSRRERTFVKLPYTPVPDTAEPTTAPDTAVPTAEPTAAPDTPAPDTPAPDTPAPDTPAPDTPAPDTPAPDTPAPDTPAPDTPAPDTPAPDTPAPDTPAPDTPAPDTPAPDTPAPDTPAPDTPAPDTPAPDTPAPDTPAPDTPAPDTPAPTHADPDYVGCFLETIHDRILNHRMPDANDMTIVKCKTLCKGEGYSFAGLQYAVECFCGGLIERSDDLRVHDSECAMPCAGDGNEICGDVLRVSAFKTHENATSAPETPAPDTPAPPAFLPNYQGCYADDVNARKLPFLVRDEPSTMSIELCNVECQAHGFVYAGVQYGKECWCGNTLDANDLIEEPKCNYTCKGAPSEMCGGYHRSSVYKVVVTQPLVYLGCYEDKNPRMLPTKIHADSVGLTIEVCVERCAAAGFAYAGLQFSQECFCGNTLNTVTFPLKAETECFMECTGNAKQLCGAGHRNSVYSTAPPAPLEPLGCYEDNANARTLPYHAKDDAYMTVGYCIGMCASKGYAYAGLQFSTQCFCGHSLPTTPTHSTRCYLPCAGNLNQRCGGGHTNMVYSTARSAIP